MVRLISLFLVCFGIASSQDEAIRPIENPDVAREKVAQWVLTKKTISGESASWDEEKQMLSDLITLREREIGQMDEVISLAKERVADVEKKSSDLKGEAQKRKAWRSQFEKRVTAIEDELISQIVYLPTPVKNKLFDALERLENRDDEGELQGRFRDVLAILNECIAFNSQIHAVPEIHEIEGRKVEVDVLYLGMKQAWYVDRTNTKAAIGLATAEGWRWTRDSSIAGRVRRAIDVQTKKDTPAFVKLPLNNPGGGE